MGTDFWEISLFLLAAIQFAAMGAAAVHALLTKSDERAAAGWVGFIILVPFIGWIVYLIFGVNRIQRRARELRGEKQDLFLLEPPEHGERRPRDSGLHLPALESLARLGQRILPESFEPGNSVRLLLNGDEAYPVMLDMIARAERSIAISTYIFNNDRAGRQFVEALSDAMARGVRVRLLIDGVGSWYSRPSIIPLLEERGINYARFLHSFMPWRMPYLNMSNHQKIMVVDGRHGFTGGMNIAEGNLHASNPKKPIRDCHFQVEGPAVAHLMHTFAYEWNFTTDEILEGEDWLPEIEPAGEVIARGLPAGPDMGLNPIRWTLLGALAEAQSSIRILTPYFIPDATLRTNLSLAAMRGVIVDIVLPEKSNLRFCDWAATPGLEWLARSGCRIWKTGAPFDHSKMMTVDGIWATIGSANWDDRSLRLNFEFNLECYGASFAGALDDMIVRRISTARPVSQEELAGRSLPVRMRDAFFRLASPYL